MVAIASHVLVMREVTHGISAPSSISSQAGQTLWRPPNHTPLPLPCEPKAETDTVMFCPRARRQRVAEVGRRSPNNGALSRRQLCPLAPCLHGMSISAAGGEHRTSLRRVNRWWWCGAATTLRACVWACQRTWALVSSVPEYYWAGQFGTKWANLTRSLYVLVNLNFRNLHIC